jgi:hypothetical protein
VAKAYENIENNGAASMAYQAAAQPGGICHESAGNYRRSAAISIGGMAWREEALFYLSA